MGGREKVMFALCAIRGIGRRFANVVCKKCDIDMNKRAGELTTDEVNKIVAVMNNPLQFKIPSWMLNRNRDTKDGKTCQKYANFLDQALREDVESPIAQGFATLLGHPCARSAHQDLGTPSRLWRLAHQQEEVSEGGCKQSRKDRQD